MNGTSRKYAWHWMVLLLIGLLALWGCPKKAEMSASPEEAPAAEQSLSGAEEVAAAPASLQPAYFDFDRSYIRDDAREVMQANAEWLKAHPQARIKIEGNCDERGTIEYNQALGQRRAANARKYLTDMGISGHRISLISYGKENPVCAESTESCWQKSRRDDFVVVPD